MVGSLEKFPEETETQYYKRMFQKPFGESEDEFVTRVNIIKKFLPKLKVWENDLYKTYINVVIKSSDIPEGYLQTKTRTVYYAFSPVLNEVSYHLHY